jgi:hypothetical protein
MRMRVCREPGTRFGMLVPSRWPPNDSGGDALIDDEAGGRFPPTIRT